MILFSPDLGIMISDTYGDAGSKELRAVAKAMRLDRDHLREEGHPANEHYRVPEAKRATIAARGVSVVSAKAFQMHQERKLAQMRPGSVVIVSKVQPDPPTQEDVVTFYDRHAARARDRGKNPRRPVPSA